MNLRNILLSVGMLALVAGALLAVLWLTQSPVPLASDDQNPAVAEKAAKPAELKAILTASHALPAGTLLRTEDWIWKDVDPSNVPADAILREEGAENKILGALTERDIAAGEAFSQTSLIKPGDRGFLAALLSPGSRAISIPVEATQTASGLLMPDNRVDIILTQSFGDSADPARKSVGETVLKNLRVIAVDQRLGMPVSPDDNVPAPANDLPKTITLEVSEREAEILTVASQLGKIEVAVRALGRADTETTPAETGMPATWAGQVSPALTSFRRTPIRSASPVSAPAAATTADATPAKASLEVMHGPKTETR